MDKVTFNDVSVYYTDKKKNEFQVIKNVTFSIRENTINTIIGPSGSGKTTLLNCISGKLVWDGEILLNGKNIEETPIFKRNISYVNQDFVLYPTLNVYDNIAMPLKAQGMDHDLMDQTIKEIADQLGLLWLLTRKPKFLSIGQQQRVAIARALAKKPELILLDEPLCNLDKETSEQVRDIIKNYIKTNKMTAIYVTHDIKDAYKMSDYIFVLDEGNLIGEYTPSTLYNCENSLIQQMLSEFNNDEKNK